MGVQVLLVDDEDELARSTTEYLGYFGITAAHVATAASAAAFLERHDVDLVLLDVNLPDGSGFDLCRRLRAESDLPILFVSARGSDDDQILGLTLGGDDYIRKPYSLSVLLAKVRRVLERASAAPRREADYDDGHLRIDAANDRVYVDGAEVSLPALEHRLLRYLVEHRGRVLTKAELFRDVWEEAITGDGTLTVHVSRLRTRIEPDPDHPRYIRTVWGRGYLFEDALG
ncbi:MAG: response regulator transcription factor [Tetrasphaera sp.]